MTLRNAVIAACGLLISCSSLGLAAPPAVETTGMWSGQVKDNSLRKLAPPTGFIVDKQAWEKICLAWRPAEQVPKVDFAKQLVLVGVVPGPNLVLMRPTIDQKGNISFLVAGTKKGGPGFGYKLIAISRQGVKTVKGKPVVSKGVQGLLLIPGNVAPFNGHTLKIQLWEYDPLLADVGAKLIDTFRVEKFHHEEGKDSNTSFSVGNKLAPRKNRRYYITVFVLKNGKRTHIGEKDGKPGLCNVLTNGNPATVKMIARSVR